MVTRLQDFGSQRGPTASPIGKFAGGWVTHVPCLVAGVLVFAATAKAYELGHSFAGSSAFWIAGAWPAYLIAAELLLAAALIAGTWPHRAWEAATLLFAVFSAVSLSKVIAGDASCGCFGDVTVSPWIALIVDLVVLVLLVFNDPPPVATVRGGSTTSIVLITGAACGALALPLAALGVGLAQPPAAMADPEHWVGMDCPALAHLDDGPSISRGEWTVIFVRPGCPKCADILDELASLANRSAVYHLDPQRWAVVFIGGERERIELPLGTTRYSLSPENARQIETPLVAWLQNGKVTAVSRDIVGAGP